MTNLFQTAFSAGLAIVATGVVLGLSAGPAFANPAPTVEVSVSKGDLATAAGRAAIDGRIRQAAQNVCGSREAFRNLQAQAVARACVAETVSAARSQVAQLRSANELAAR